MVIVHLFLPLSKAIDATRELQGILRIPEHAATPRGLDEVGIAIPLKALLGADEAIGGSLARNHGTDVAIMAILVGLAVVIHKDLDLGASGEGWVAHARSISSAFKLSSGQVCLDFWRENYPSTFKAPGQLVTHLRYVICGFPLHRSYLG